MPGGDRLRRGILHELDVEWRLVARGWDVHRFGLGTFAESVRRAVGRHDTRARFLPDLVASSGSAVVFVDPKHGHGDVQHTVEIASLNALESWARWTEIPVFLVFGDGGTIDARDAYAAAVVATTPPSTGSGTPFYWIRRELCSPFDATFGPARVEA